MFESTPVVAFDQHAASVTAAVLFPGSRQPALHQLAPDLPTIRRFLTKVRRQGAVRCCYEAGPCGFELQRALTADGVPCDVIAPALIPRRALGRRQQGQPEGVCQQAWQAQQRLYQRYRRLTGRGKPKQHVVTAVGRELTGFLWAALTR